MKFVIVSPRQMCGGAIVLHALCKYLMELGYDAKIFYCGVTRYDKERPYVFWAKWIKYVVFDAIHAILAPVMKHDRRFAGFIDVPVRGCKRKYLPRVDNDTIVVYSEVYFGNFLHAEKVVRWFLYQDESAEAYEKDALFITFRDVFNDVSLNPTCRRLIIEYYDLETYKQTNTGKREGKCYIIRKGRNRTDLPEKFDGIIIDNLTEKEIVKVFNQCEYCISYDTQTAYSDIAAICGCVSVIVPEEGKKKEDYVGSDDSDAGVAYGFSDEEINRARQTCQQLRQEFIAWNENSKKSAKDFAMLCESFFN